MPPCPGPLSGPRGFSVVAAEGTGAEEAGALGAACAATLDDGGAGCPLLLPFSQAAEADDRTSNRAGANAESRAHVPMDAARRGV